MFIISCALFLVRILSSIVRSSVILAFGMFVVSIKHVIVFPFKMYVDQELMPCQLVGVHVAFITCFV